MAFWKRPVWIANGIVGSVFLVHAALSRYFLAPLMTWNPYQGQSSVVISYPNAETAAGRLLAGFLKLPIHDLIHHEFIPRVTQALNSALFSVLAFALAVAAAERVLTPVPATFQRTTLSRVIPVWIGVAAVIVLSERLWPYI